MARRLKCEPGTTQGADGQCWKVEFVKVSLKQGMNCRQWPRTVELDGAKLGPKLSRALLRKATEIRRKFER